MVPLIDSFFLILVYFIYAFLSVSVHRGIPLRLPEAVTAETQKQEYHAVSVTEEGDIFWDGQKMSLPELGERLGRAKSEAGAKGPAIYIFGDELAYHGIVVSVFDEVRKAGVEKVYIETEAGRYDR